MNTRRRLGAYGTVLAGLLSAVSLPSVSAQSGHPISDIENVVAEALPVEVSPQPLAFRTAEFARLKTMAEKDGRVRVIVQLRVPQYEVLRAESIRAKRPDLAARADRRLELAVQASAQAELAALAGVDHVVHRTFPYIPYTALSVSPRAMDRLAASPNVMGIEEDRLAKPMLNNTVNIVGASAAWAQGFDGSGWHVAILDTGLRDSHNAFAGKNIVQACFASGTDGGPVVGDCPNGAESDTTSVDAARTYATSYEGWDHGTHVSGIAVGNDVVLPRYGVAREADLIAIQVFSRFTASGSCDPPGTNCLLTFSSDYIAALNHVYSLRTTHNIASANMSLGGGSFNNQNTCDLSNGSTKTAIDNLRTAGIVTAIATGNDGICGAISSPGCISSAVAVGAVNDSDSEAGFSNYHNTLLDIFAPGVSVSAAWAGSDSGYASFSGTSMATPHVAGTWAILRQAAPNESVGFLFSLLHETGAPISGGCGVPVPPQRRIQIDAVTEIIGASVRPCDLSGEITAGDPDASAEFGYAVSLQGSAAAIGARREDCPAGSDCGAVYMHRWDGAAWNADGKLQSSDVASIDRFGSSIALHGDRLLVGSPTADLPALLDAGAVYAYEYDGLAWGDETKVAASDADAGDQFGWAMAMDGDVAVIAAVNEGGRGAAYVFRHDGAAWVEEAKLVPVGAAAADAIGQSVAIDGDVIVIGGNNVNCPAGADCGAAWVFRWNGSAWVEELKLTAPDAFAGDWFGFAVAVHENDLLVGSPVDNCTAGTVCGSIHAFEWNGTTWIHGGKVVPYDQDTGDFFGATLVMQGDTALTGASSNDCLGASNCGSAYVLRKEDGDWAVDAKFNAPVEEVSASFGQAVSLDGPLAVITSRLRDANSLTNSGAAYMYAAALDCNGNRISDTCDILSGFSLDDDIDGEPDECVCPPSSVVTADPVLRNRYLAFSGGDAGRPQAVRIRFANLPGAYAAFNDKTMWLSAPQTICENSGQTTPPGGGCASAPGAPTLSLQAATLQCTPTFRDWSGDGQIHVSHRLLIPGGEYEVQVIDEDCAQMAEDDFSVALSVDTCAWGDVVSNCVSLPCGPPNNIIDGSDILAILDKFKNIASGPIKSRCDLEPATPDRIISISDVTSALGAFSAGGFPFAPGSFPCP
jgi:subtilisin family serine protease